MLGGRCIHCELNLVVESLLTGPRTGKIAPELVAISEAMKPTTSKPDDARG